MDSTIIHLSFDWSVSSLIYRGIETSRHASIIFRWMERSQRYVLRLKIN